MSLEAVLVNGKVEFDTPPTFPEGTRVSVDLADEFSIVFPFGPYDRAKELAILLASIEDVKGGRTRPFDEAMAQIAAAFNLVSRAGIPSRRNR